MKSTGTLLKEILDLTDDIPENDTPKKDVDDKVSNPNGKPSDGNEMKIQNETAEKIKNDKNSPNTSSGKNAENDIHTKKENENDVINADERIVKVASVQSSTQRSSTPKPVITDENKNILQRKDCDKNIGKGTTPNRSESRNAVLSRNSLTPKNNPGSHPAMQRLNSRQESRETNRAKEKEIDSNRKAVVSRTESPLSKMSSNFTDREMFPLTKMELLCAHKHEIEHYQQQKKKRTMPVMLYRDRNKKLLQIEHEYAKLKAADDMRFKRLERTLDPSKIPPPTDSTKFARTAKLVVAIHSLQLDAIPETANPDHTI